MLVNDHRIKQMVQDHRVIEPFSPHLVREGVISYGLSSFGHDFRLADEFLVPSNHTGEFVLDPKHVSEEMFVRCRGNECTVPAHSYVLGRSLEYFRIPRTVLALCAGKSTYARCGILVNVTPLEPEWEGFITVSIANIGAYPVKIYAGEGLGQIIFFEGPSPDVSYADRKGKYQCQDRLTLSKL